MTDMKLDYLPHYEKMIVSHHHDLEGIYIGVYNKSMTNIKYSDLIPADNIKLNMYDQYDIQNYNIIDNKPINIYLSVEESRMFDIMTSTMTDFKNSENSTYCLTIENMSEKNIEFIQKHYKYNNSSVLKQGGKPLRNDTDYQIIIYKYIDPVIRMCCEYAILFDQKIRLDEDNYKLFLDKDGNISEDKINSWLHFVWEKRDVKPEGVEGTICVFGIGKIDCCSQTLHNEHLSKLRINQRLFNLDDYQRVINEHPKYKSVPPLNDLFELNLNPAHTYLLESSDENENSKNMILVQILQLIFDKIVEKSGRAEGISKGGESYPRIHVLEVIDPANEIWILRSEHFHLSKSPCVHNGLKYKSKINYFLNYLGLWDKIEQLRFADVNLLHSIAHALDRLYCGHSGHFIGQSNNLTQRNIFSQIKQIFRIFLELKSSRGDHSICNLIPIDPSDIDCVDLFYYICMNDQDSIYNKLIKMTIAKLKKLNLPDDIKKLHDKSQIIKFIITNISLCFDTDVKHDNFPFYNFKMSYDDTVPNRLSILPDCDIKIKYDCKQSINIDEIDFLRQT